MPTYMAAIDPRTLAYFTFQYKLAVRVRLLPFDCQDLTAGERAESEHTASRSCTHIDVSLISANSILWLLSV
jgi:hypothetical protein